MKNALLRSLVAILIGVASINVARGTNWIPASPISLETALADARVLAAQHGNMMVMRIEGVSMLPYFGEDSVLVVKKINPAHLHQGMLAVYRNRFGDTIVHRLMAPVAGGWQVKGWNNYEPDTTVVNGSNLIGVVYATFHTSGPSEMPAVYASPDVKVAWAAPAK